MAEEEGQGHWQVRAGAPDVVTWWVDKRAILDVQAPSAAGAWRTWTPGRAALGWWADDPWAGQPDWLTENAPAEPRGAVPGSYAAFMDKRAAEAAEVAKKDAMRQIGADALLRAHAEAGQGPLLAPWDYGVQMTRPGLLERLGWWLVRRGGR